VDKIRQALDRAKRERAELATPSAYAVEAERRIEREPLVRVRPPAEQPPDPPAADSPSAPTGFHFEAAPAALEARRVLGPNAVGPAADAFRLLRTQVLAHMRERGWQTLGVVSARAMDGRTTVAANLAITIAADPRHTALLVDLGLREPGVARLFGFEPPAGVEEILRGEQPVEACIAHPTNFQRLRILPARRAVESSSALIAGGRCTAFVSELRTRYSNRIIVLDLPPVLDADDAVLVAAQLDCVLFVVTEGRTARADVTQALELLRKTPVVGTVLNGSSALPRSGTGG
jgi:Mrp family chromosome partitioning ATPase